MKYKRGLFLTLILITINIVSEAQTPSQGQFGLNDGVENKVNPTDPTWYYLDCPAAWVNLVDQELICYKHGQHYIHYSQLAHQPETPNDIEVTLETAQKSGLTVRFFRDNPDKDTAFTRFLIKQ